MAAIFTPRRVEALRPRVEAIAKEVIDRIAPNGTADGINDIAAQLPMRVIAELLGVPERSEQIFDISNRMVGAVDGGPDARLEQSLEAALEIHLLGQEIAREKRSSDDGTVMSAYVDGTLEGVEGDQRGATDDEAGWFLMMMSVAGNETVRTATAQSIRILAEWPDQRDLQPHPRHPPLRRGRAPAHSAVRGTAEDAGGVHPRSLSADRPTAAPVVGVDLRVRRRTNRRSRQLRRLW